MLGRLGTQYGRLLHSRPITTKSFTGGLIMTTADVTQQAMEQRKASANEYKWDMHRTARLAGFYSVFQMPFVHHWFQLLERAFGPASPWKETAKFFGKVAADQSIGLPTVLATFCLTQPMLQGKGLFGDDGGLAKFQRDFTTMVLSGWCVWVPTITAVFAFVPLAFRPLTINMVSLGWSTYVSSMN